MSEPGGSIMQKTLRNSLCTVVAQICIVVMQFINRRLFIQYLGEELLGYQSVLANVFAWLLVADVGIGNVILYRFYKAISRNDREEIITLMTVNRYYNYAIAAVMTVLSGVLFLFLPYIINDTTIPFAYTVQIYALYVLSVVGNCFVSHRVIILHAQQQSYLCDRIDITARFAVAVLQLAVMMLTRNFMLYLAVNLSGTLLSNGIASRRAVKEYPFIKEKRRLTFRQLREMDLFKDCGNYIAHKLSWTVFNSTDSLVLSAICGIKTVALYSNYAMLQSQVNQFIFNRLMNVFHVSVGHVMYGEAEEQHKKRTFQMMESITFLLAALVGTCFLTLFQPFIVWWLGDRFLLPFGFVILFVLTITSQLIFENLNTYRSAYGGFERDRNYMILSALLNIAVSVPLAKRLGVIGVQIGTLVALVPIFYIRSRLVVADIWHESLLRYWLQKLLLLGLVALEAELVYNVTVKWPVTLAGILARCALCVVLPTGMNALILWKTQAFQDVLVYIRRALAIFKAKFGK